MRFLCNSAYSWLFRELKSFGEQRIINRSKSFLTDDGRQSCRFFLFLSSKQCSINHRLLFHDNSTGDNQRDKKRSADSDDEREKLWKLLESAPRRKMETIEQRAEIPVLARSVEKSFAEGNYVAAINTYQLLINQRFELDWLPYWEMCLGDCHQLNNPPLRDIVRSWHHYECALTKYPQQITLDIMLRVIRSSLDVLEELNTSTRAVELCAKIIDTTSNLKNKENQSDTTSYQIFDHVRMAYVSKKKKEVDKVLFHANEALTLYKKKRESGSIWKVLNNDDTKTLLKWIAEICIAEKAYDIALKHLYELNDVLTSEGEETSYDARRHPSFRVSTNLMIASVFEKRNKDEWRQALTYYHAALYNLRLMISSATMTEGRLHFDMSTIWLQQPDAHHLFTSHMAIVAKVHQLNTAPIMSPPMYHLMSFSERAQQYEKLAVCYDSKLAFDKLGIAAKTRSIDYASLAMELFKKAQMSSEHLTRLELFIKKIKEQSKLQGH